MTRKFVTWTRQYTLPPSVFPLECVCPGLICPTLLRNDQAIKKILPAHLTETSTYLLSCEDFWQGFILYCKLPWLTIRYNPFGMVQLLKRRHDAWESSTIQLFGQCPVGGPGWGRLGTRPPASASLGSADCWNSEIVGGFDAVLELSVCILEHRKQDDGNCTNYTVRWQLSFHTNNYLLTGYGSC